MIIQSKRFIVSGSNIILNIESGKIIRTLSGHSEWVGAVAYSSDGKYIISGSGDKTIKIWAEEIYFGQ